MEGNIHIILGYFNTNALEENKNKKLKGVLINYNKILLCKWNTNIGK